MLRRKKSVFNCNVCNQQFHSAGTYKDHMFNHDIDGTTVPIEPLDENDNAIINHFFEGDEPKLEIHLEIKEGIIAAYDKNDSIPLDGKGETDDFKNDKTTGIDDLQKDESATKCCKTCGKWFRDKHRLHQHLMTHRRIFKCTVCERTFASKYNLQVHSRTHSGEKPYSCFFCGKDFKFRTSFLAHIQSHTRSKPYSCETCGKQFGKKDRLTTHMRLHSGEKPHQCDVCEKKYHDRQSLYNHMKIHIREGTHSPPKSSLSPSSFKCKVCNQGFKRQQDLRTHCSKLHHQEPNYESVTCQICCVKFDDESELQNHFQIHMDAKIFGCDLCDRRFMLESTYLRHVQGHEGNGDNTCSECGRKFVESHHMKMHLKTHRRNPCPDCDLVFDSSAELQSHATEVHYDNYKCQKCLKNFNKADDYQNHKCHN